MAFEFSGELAGRSEPVRAAIAPPGVEAAVFGMEHDLAVKPDSWVAGVRRSGLAERAAAVAVSARLRAQGPVQTARSLLAMLSAYAPCGPIKEPIRNN